VKEARVADSAAATPRTVFESLIHGITDGAWDTLADLYAEDVVVDQPFGLPAPLHLEGRDQLAAHFAGARQLPLELAARNLVIHETLDPEVVIGEFDYDGRITSTGRTFTVANLIVLRVRDGRIVASRDYHNHAVMNEILGPLLQPAAAV
jgi:ketosteroid isomerase-like protein